MKHFLCLALFYCLFICNPTYGCDGLNGTVSNVYIGNGQYLLTINICEFVSNGNGFNQASVFGIIITVNGANVIEIAPPFLTGNSSGISINGYINSSNQVVYGDWGNSAASVFLAYGEPSECWTIELIVDGPAVTIDVLCSSFDGLLQPGSGMNLINGIWACGIGIAVPPAICNSDWTPPILCEGSTTPIDLNLTTVNTGIFSGVNVDSITGMFDPTGLTGNIPIILTVGDSLFSCSTELNIILNPIVFESIDASICEGRSYTYPDGSTSTNIQVNESNITTLVSSVTGCDSVITTNLTVQPNPTIQVNALVCPGSSFTYPDGTVETNIISPTSQTSTLISSVTGCDSLITTSLNLHTIPTVQFDKTVCAGDDFTFPDGTTSTNILVAESQTSTIQSVSTGCDSIIVTNISVAAPIQASIAIDISTGCVPQTVTLSNMSIGGPFQNCFWDFGNGTTSIDCGDQIVTFNDVVTNTFSLIVQNGCYQDTAFILFVGENCSIFVPNVVSTSSTNGNNTWFVTAESLASFHCVIINRWGNKVKELTSLNDHWDATTKSGNIVNEGTYYYIIDVVYLNGQEEQKHGFIQVVH
ncbi:MAG: gliding motility-associated C-terminal domain-containing protein [Crocinitomicaceae bacterium]|nr:gliding motility-associated C-terminal domain-containing protein [Crocinitomicaceae bacterium]